MDINYLIVAYRGFSGNKGSPNESGLYTDSEASKKWLNDNKVKIFKVGSGECNNTPLISYISSFKKPMIISTGMNTIDSCKETYDYVKNKCILLKVV